MSSHVYLDLETTGLDPSRHEAWEVAWAVDDSEIQSGLLHHSLANADPTALRLNGYYGRYGFGLPAEYRFVDEAALKDVLHGATLVAANPHFDASFLFARWGFAPWRYRLLDVEAYAMGAFLWGHPKGLKDIRAELLERGYDIPENDHTAAADVDTLRACHIALKSIYHGVDQ